MMAEGCPGKKNNIDARFCEPWLAEREVTLQTPLLDEPDGFLRRILANEKEHRIYSDLRRLIQGNRIWVKKADEVSFGGCKLERRGFEIL